MKSAVGIDSCTFLGRTFSSEFKYTSFCFVDVDGRRLRWPVEKGRLHFLLVGWQQAALFISLLFNLKTFCIQPGYNFLNPHTPNTRICITLCYNLPTLELFAYPLILKYPLRNHGLDIINLIKAILDISLNIDKKYNCWIQQWAQLAM